MKQKAYARAGVDIDLGNRVKATLPRLLRAATRPEVLGKVGGFGGLFALDVRKYKEPVLVSSVDGVGTKLKVAFAMDRHETIGQDLVNHCVNDIAVLGAEPLFFLDYIGTSRLEPRVFAGIIRGFAKACAENHCALIGGETAQMPGFYAHVVHEGRTSTTSALGRAAFVAIGFLLVPLAIMAAELATGAPLFLTGMRRLAGTVTDGYAPEGFGAPWAYLWHAEHGLLLLWLAAALFVVFDNGAWHSRRRRTASAWILCAAGIYLGLAFSSSVLHAFVVMGRQSRQVVPFFCLGAAAAIAELLERRRWAGWIVGACAAALVLQVGWNFRQPLQQRFPRDVIAEITAKYGPVDFDLSIEGPPLTNAHVESRWVLLNAQHLYHPRAPRPPLPPGILEVMRFPHPLQFLPYQYEGLEPMERQLLRGNDIAMRLIDIGPPVDRLP